MAIHGSPVDALRETLCSESAPLGVRFRALFSLKHLASAQPPTLQSHAAIQAIAAALPSDSSLLVHELCYVLGQTENEAAAPHLTDVLQDTRRDPMCRHEAAEALGALGHQASLPLLRRLRDDPAEQVVVKETCEIAVDRLEWEAGNARKQEQLKKSDFTSIDPAPPLPQSGEQVSIVELEKTFLDTTLPLFQRYRAMFALRDLASPPDLPTAISAVQSLAKGLDDPSDLFSHECAFIFGQLSHPASIPALVAALSDTTKASMIRHEAAEALGGLGAEDGVEEVLKKFLNDPERVVRESVVVALDMAEYERGGETEYATVPGATKVA